MVSKAQNFGYFALFGMLLWPIISSFAPQIEGKLFPVVVSTELTKVIVDDETHSLIYGDSRKVRECTYIKMDWYYGSPEGKSVLVPLHIMERSRIREEGFFSFGPWQLNLSKDLVRNSSFAIVTHRCHPFWNTQTTFWP